MTDRSKKHSQMAANSSRSGAVIETAQRTLISPYPATTGSTNTSALTADTAKIPTTTLPQPDPANGVGIIYPQDNWIYITPIAKGVNNAGGAFKIWGWREIVASAGGVNLFVPYLVAQGEFVINTTLVGVTNTNIDQTWYFADEIVFSRDNTLNPPSAQVHNIADVPAYAYLDFGGHPLLEVEMTTAHSTATDVTACGLYYWTT